MKQKFERVFVVEDFGKYDLVTLERNWGPITIISTKDYPTHSDGASWVNRYKVALRDFSTDDALVLVGDPILIGIAFNEAAKRNTSVIHCLKWNNRINDYYDTAVWA